MLISEQQPTDLFNQPAPTGEELKQDGIRRAVEHADRTFEKWSAKAFHALELFLKTNTAQQPFLMEDVRKFAAWLDEPPSLRAWGAIAIRAAKAGLIVKAGHATVSNAKAHKCFASLWKLPVNA